MKVLAVGATGEFARMVVPYLKKDGHHVIALIRNEVKKAEALKNGADEVVIGNLTDLESLKRATKDIDAVFHVIPAFQDEVDSGINMIEAARSSGVKKFVFSSVYHPSLSLVNHADKRPAEEALYKSGMDYTILQPAMFMQQLLSAARSGIESGKISGPYSKTAKISYVDYIDVAEVAAMAMTDERLANGTFELSSPGMYSREDIAALLSKQLNKEVTAGEIAPHAAIAQMKLPELMAKPMEAMFEEYDKYGFSGGNSLILETILKRKPTTVEKFIADALS